MTIDKFRYSFIAGTLGQLTDRYLRSGYKQQVLDTAAIVDAMAAYNVVHAVEIHCRGNETKAEILELEAALQRNKLAVSCVNAWLYGEAKWKLGSLTAGDPTVRSEAIAMVKKAIEYARRMHAECVNLWLGQDGFDYAFQTDYAKQWNWMIEALREVADEAPDLKIAIEPKPREPRNRSLVDTVPTALLLCLEADRNNLGLTVDLGHTLYAGQSMAQTLCVAERYRKLFHVHVNDNYGHWDDDMIVGSVHFLEWLEAVYVLKKMDYAGYISVDIFPYREHSFESVAESIKYFQVYDRLIDKIGMDQIADIIRKQSATNMMRLIRETIFI